MIPHLATLELRDRPRKKKRLKFLIQSKYARAGLLKSSGVNLWMYRHACWPNSLEKPSLCWLREGSPEWVEEVADMQRSSKAANPLEAALFMPNSPGPLGAWVFPGKGPSVGWNLQLLGSKIFTFSWAIGIHWPCSDYSTWLCPGHVWLSGSGVCDSPSFSPGSWTLHMSWKQTI